MSASRRPGTPSNLFPSKELLLDSCAGKRGASHPVLWAAGELALAHTELRTAAGPRGEIAIRRTSLVRHIDRWLAAELPSAHGGAHLHTESVGAVVDRLARYSVLARGALTDRHPEPELHHAWHRLSELALGYRDLAFEVGAGLRRIPDLTDPGLTL
ncbi:MULTISPECIES: DUF4254 domain-containing protein [Nocardia]|uniref:DUF4254 domain-containing protein n=1 Tax=Nocardia aurea TaxID=2144174 RepID=A0ABV3FM52_9NOCA|nr:MULTISPECIES: DUF4254 domain-containing protein [Nocardia]